MESGEKGFNKVESLGRERGGVWGGEREPFFRKVPSPLPNLLFSNPLPAYSTALPILFKRMLLRPSADQ